MRPQRVMCKGKLTAFVSRTLYLATITVTIFLACCAGSINVSTLRKRTRTHFGFVLSVWIDRDAMHKLQLFTRPGPDPQYPASSVKGG